MSSTYGNHLKLSIFGQSHGPAIGMTLDGIPAGLPVDLERLQAFLNRRAPGRNAHSTPRKESDQPQFLAGIVDGYTCGAPLAAVIHNTNTRSSDYSDYKNQPRPGHADYAANIKYQGYQDVAGGGHFSGRLTAPLCIAGGLCLQWLQAKGISIAARIVSIGDVDDDSLQWNTVSPDLSLVDQEFPVLTPSAGQQMQQAIEQARLAGDSLGGIIECVISGVPAGLGGPMFGGIEGKIAQIIYGIPAVKGLEFGSGFQGSKMTGSQNNDGMTVRDGIVNFQTNHCGGILGGISTGTPIVFRTAMKPTPSISKEQTTVDLMHMQETSIRVTGRHDPCIVPRAVPVIEAAAAIAIFDIMLGD